MSRGVVIPGTRGLKRGCPMKEGVNGVPLKSVISEILAKKSVISKI